jgi:serine/threonine protein kinase
MTGRTATGKSSKKSLACKRPKCGFAKFITPDGKQCVEIKYVGRGSFGCVISPPIVDNIYILKHVLPYTDKDNKDVAKLFFRNDDFKEEFKFAKFMQKIDPDNKFTVKVKGVHKIHGKCLQLSEGIMYCLHKKIKDVRNAKFHQMIMENGGISLNLQNQYSISYPEFLKIFKNFITGMITMQHYNIIHRDIKPHNVLIDMNKKKLNLIDFSLMCSHYKELYDGREGNMILLKSAMDYVYYPPEFYVGYIMLKYRYLYENNKDAFDKFIDSIYEKMEQRGFFQQEKLLIDSYFKQEYEFGVKSFLQTVKNSGFTKCQDIFNRDLAMKADVYAIASVITSLSNNIVYTSHSQQQFIDYIFQKCIKANPYERVSFTELYSILSSEEMRSNTSDFPKYRIHSQTQNQISKRGGNILSVTASARPSARPSPKASAKPSNKQTSRFASLTNLFKSSTKQSTSSKPSRFSRMKAKLLPFVAMTVSKMRNLFNKDHASPRKYFKSSHSRHGSINVSQNKKLLR